MRAVPIVFTLSAGERLPLLTETFRRDAASMALEPLRAHVLHMGHEFIDASVQGLVLGLITDGVGVSAFTESLMRGLASLVESVGSKLVDQVLKKAPQNVLMLLDRPADTFLAERSGADGWIIKPIDPLRVRKAARTIAGGGTFQESVAVA